MGEAEIINGLKQGRRKGTFRKFVDHYRQQVVNTCFGLLHNAEDAEDVAQDVFIEVFRSMHKFKGQSKISTWLYRIAVTRSLNFIRNNKKHSWFKSFDGEVKSKLEALAQLKSDDNDNPEYTIENRQRAVVLHEAIDALPKNQRVAFTLNKYDDMSYKEVSEVMNLSVSSVESLIHRAKINLQKKLYMCYKKKCI
jgi:RNA polymerase sigma-70 factor, ECF subfamily